ncbi:MAG: hypothetical protein QG658_11 [Patescibacteria group bacterium]|nr:hypothetical protein [Patescibacteria group bacterium]
MATPDDKIKPTGPSIADGSMAYMPKPEGAEATEGEDEIRLDHNKKEETQTMADIAEELGGDKITNTPQADGVKVAVNDKPKKADIKKPTKPEPEVTPEIIEPEVIDDGNIPPAYEAERSHESKGGGKGFLVFLLIVALVAAGIFGYLWWTEKQQVATLQSEVDKLTEANKGLSGETTTAVATSDTRTIPELGLSYAFGDDVAAVTYRFRETTDANKQAHKVITFSSTKVVEAERKVSNTAPKCTAEFGPLGSLTSYATGDTYKGGKIEDVEVDNETVLKLGDTYFVYEAAQSACSSDATVQEVVTAEKTAVQAFVKSLKEQQ